jgi:iron complex outermembrane receptor protein
MFADASGGGRAGRLRLYAGVHGFVSRGAFGFRQDPGTALNPADDSNMFRSDSDTRQADGVLRAAVDLPGRRALSVAALGFARDQGLPGQQMFAAPTGARFRTGRGLGYARYESSDDLGGGGRLAAQLFASAERDTLDDPNGQVAATPTVTHDTTLSLGASAHARRPLLPWLGAAAMLEGRGETFRPVDDAQTAAGGVPARRLVGAAGAEIDLWLRPLDLDVIPSARVEAVQDVASDRGATVTGMQPPAGAITRALPVLRAGLVRPFGRAVTVKANAGRYARIPTFLELYGMNGRLLGNPTLQPERGDNADLALWIDGAAAGGRVQLASRTTAFGARVQDLIGWEVTSWGQTRAENLSSTRVLGAEQELRVAAGRHARVVAQLTYTDARDEGPSTAHHGRQLPLHPRWHLYGRPELLRLRAGRLVELGAFADADYTAGNHADGANLIALPRRLLIGAGLSAELPRLGLRVTASGQNLGNSSVPDFVGWPLPGRSVFVALGWSSAVQSRSD